MKTNKIAIFFMLAFALLISLFNVNTSVNAATPKELTNIVSGVQVWSPTSNRYEQEVNGVLPLIQGRLYRLEFAYDLAKYDNGANGGVNNGDYFIVDIPLPISLRASNDGLTDPDTGIEIGTFEVLPAGERQGGRLKVTLKNLEQYMAAKQSTTVFGIQGKLYAAFIFNDLNTQGGELPFNNTVDGNSIVLKYTVSPPPVMDYSDRIGKENLAKVGNIAENAPWTSAKLNASGQHRHYWTIRVNARKETYQKLTLVDTISETGGPAQFIPEHLEVYSGEYQPSTFAFDPALRVKQVEGVDYTVTYNSSYTEFKIEFINPGDKAYAVHYNTTGTFDGGKIANRAQIFGDNDTPLAIRTDTQVNYTLEERNSRLTQGGTITIDTSYTLLVYKVDGDTFKKLAGAIFEVETPDGQKVILPPTDENGMTKTPRFTQAEAAAGQFILRELTPPPGYKRITDPMTLTIPQQGVVRTIKNTKDVTSVKVNKAWVGPVGTEAEVKVFNENDLNTALETKTITAAENWETTFTNLPALNTDGSLAKYTVKETPVANYTTEISGDQTTGFKVTNTNNETVNLKVNKVWVGEKAVNVEVKVYNQLNENTAVDTLILDEATNWEATSVNLPKYNADGSVATYVVKETPIANYTTEVSGDQTVGFTVKNTNTETVNVKVNKVWVGPKTDSVEVNIFNQLDVNTPVATLVLNEATYWEATTANLPKFNADGSVATYVVKETPIANYTTEVSGDQTSGFTVKNTNNETVEVSIVKKWVGTELDEVNVEVLRNDVVIDTVKLNTTNDFQLIINNLPKYDSEGKLYHYDVKEVEVAGYSVKVERNLNNFTITNTQKPTKPPVDTADYASVYAIAALVSLIGLFLIKNSDTK